MIREILIWPEPILERRCEEVKAIDVDILRLLNDMEETMLMNKGAGLAASQVGFALRLVTVLVRSKEGAKVLKLVNPRVTACSETKQTVREGCLSLPGYFDYVKRHRSVTVEAQDETGAQVEIKADGVLAQALQHEVEHLDGILFVDSLSVLKRNLVEKKFTKLKKRGIRYQAEKPESKDFTDPATGERMSIAPQLLEAVSEALPKDALTFPETDS